MSKSLNIGFIGIGNMGLPIAKNLIAAGFNVTIYNRTLAKTEPLQLLGASIASSIQQAVKNADVVVTMLSDDAALNDVSKQIIPSMKQGAIHF